MAITLSDFNKIWASTSPLTPYSFSDANYQQGWNFVGATPPARQMWDSYMKFSDEKQKYIVDNFLPLSGGTMTGDLEIKKSAPATSLTNNDFASRGSTVSANTSIGSVSFNAGNGGIIGRISSYVYASDQDSRIVFTVAKNESTASTFSWVLLNPTSGDRAFYPLTNNASTLGIPNYTWKHLYCGGADFTSGIEFTATYPNNFPLLQVNSTSLTIGTNPSSLKANNVFVAKDSTNASIYSMYYTLSSTGISALRLYNNWNGDYYVSVYSSASGKGFFAGIDNGVDLGSGSYRWKQLFAGTSTINTSDERLKDNIEKIPDEVIDAWGEVGWYQFQFKDSIAQKGENARIHTGTIAQRIKETFEKHNLDAFRYGLLCYDSWDATEEEKDEDGKVVQEYRPAGDLYSLRYEEALCMEASYQRRRADRLEARLNALEERIARLEVK